MNAYIGKQLNLSHCKVIVFSEALASKGIKNEIYTLVNNNQIRPSTNIIISKCDAKEYIEKSNPVLENLITRYYEIFPSSSKYTGYTYNATIGSFFNSIICRTCEPYAILGGILNEKNSMTSVNNPDKTSNIKSNNTSIVGKRGAENIGLAAFKEGTLVGELNASETICFSIIKQNMNGFLITIPDPNSKNKEYLDIYIYPHSNVDTNVDIINGSPYISLKCKFKGKIYSINTDSNLLNKDRIKEISEAANYYLENIFTSYLYKTSKELKSDINGFGRSSLSKFKTLDKLNDYNWLENYENSFFDVKFETDIESGFLITDT